MSKSERVPPTHLRMATVMASGEVAQGQMTSGFRPWDWNTFRKASQEDTDPEDATLKGVMKSRLLLKNMTNGLEDRKHSQGLAPSATISIRKEARLMSLCSRWAIMAQCRSRHFTKATRAAQKSHRCVRLHVHAPAKYGRYVTRRTCKNYIYRRYVVK